MGNIFAKANMSLKFQDPKQSFKAGEQIDLVVEFQSNKVFEDAEIKVVFKDNQNTFQIKKILSVGKWNNKESINKTHEIKFDVASPVDVALPENVSIMMFMWEVKTKCMYLKGVYTMEAKLKVMGHLWKSTKAKASINIPLVTK